MTKPNLEGQCNSCKKESSFVYIGQMGNKTLMKSLYNCKACGSSVMEQSIRQKCYLLQYDGMHCKELNCDGYMKNFCWTPEYRNKNDIRK